jgi:dTDP-4-amino-4,6-dideoxygalactose transaminase
VFADYVALSFQAIKHLTTGDGGALIVPELEVRRAKLLRWFGLDRETPQTDFRGEQDITEAGWKFQMNDIAATIGLANLEGIDEVLLKHRENAAFYNANLAAGFTRTTPTYRHEGSWWVYTVLLPTEAQRDEFKRYMVDKGIQVSQVHWRNDKLSIFSHFRSELPGVDEFASRMICLPVHPDTPVQRVLQVANSFFGEANE